MSDNSKKRSNSFRKIFPSLFFSHKSKDKNPSKKNTTENYASKGNTYQNPRCIISKSEKYMPNTDDNNDRLYENLSVANRSRVDNDIYSKEMLSNNSSSSTLVSENLSRVINEKETYNEKQFSTYSAKPQVPPKPNNENMPNQSSNSRDYHNAQYPDVYYHSMEKLSNKITPIDEIEIYRASQSKALPTSVGAEIKKVSTKILISPKKEAEVRTIQPIRARSLSFEKDHRKESNVMSEIDKKKDAIQKPYNYSAPTSPISVNHKIPNMPTTVSPYEHVRKTMIEAEEKRNSLSRTSIHNKSTPSPSPQYMEPQRVSTPMTHNKFNKTDDSIEREMTRQKVEAFYWQKIKEQKQREDEYLLRQSLNSSLRSPLKYNTSYSNSNRSTPSSFALETRSSSLPRGRDPSFMINQPIYAAAPFVRGAQERRTDSYVVSRSSYPDQDIVYRNPEKLIYRTSPLIARQQIPIIQRGSLTQEPRNMNQQTKRVSFEENFSATNTTSNSDISHAPATMKCVNELSSPRQNSNTNMFVKSSECLQGTIRDPPLPPVRTTSVGSAGKSYRIVDNKRITHLTAGGYSVCSESESGSEAGEIQKILQGNINREEDWQDGSRCDGGLSDGEATRGPTRSRGSRREDPRRHTLSSGNQHLYVNPHPQGQHELEPPLPRGYPPQNNALLFDDDPGVMSEVETASTGFRRGGKQRSSLPVVRTPSKTLERPLGLVFLQYRSETKRALLPNEITSIDTVKALFVRSFSQQLTMAYMDSPRVKIYIHDSNKDMFYELEDVRAHLRDIRDRSVLRVLEAGDLGGGPLPGAVAVGTVAMPPGAATCPGASNWDQDQSYFSEPEIDSEYHHQHVHKTKVKPPAYYMGGPAPSTLPRGGSVLRAYSPAAPPVPADRVKTLPAPGPSVPRKPMRSHGHGGGSERCFPFGVECPRSADQLYTIPVHAAEGYMSSPERAPPRGPYEDPYYTQFLGPSTSRAAIAPVIDEEAGDGVMIDDAYGVYPITTAPRALGRPPYDARLGQVEEMQRLRVEKMERQLANLTGLVQQALQVPAGAAAPTAAPRNDFPTYNARPQNQDAVRFASHERPPKLGKDRFQKSVSFEKSVSFSDDPPDMNSPKQHSPQHAADTKPTKPAIKSSTLPRTSSQERDRLKPAPPPKPAGLGAQPNALAPQRTYQINVTPDFFSQMRSLLKQSRDLRIETRNLRRSTLSHAMQMRQMMADTIVKIGALSASYNEQNPESQLTREEEIYRQEMLLLENDLYELEATVERLRGQAANRETRVNMADIERIAMVLSKSSKTVADWKLKFPILHDTMKAKLACEMEKVVRKEKMLEDEPERLELALRRCKKLTGTLVTLKRLACVQEQRLPLSDGRASPESSQSSFTAGPSSEECNSENVCPMAATHNKAVGGRNGASRGAAELRPENALDALLDELQTFAKPSERGGRGEGPLRRLHSYPSGSDTDASPPVRARGQHPPKPPVPERHPELLALAARRAPPPPPPRTTSRSPLASPTSPSSPSSPPSPRSPPRAPHAPHVSNAPHEPDDENAASRQALLEHRHQELLKKQKALQEQYARLQMIQRSSTALPPNAQPDLKKTGSESNLLSKMNLNLAPANMSGSMTHLAGDVDRKKNAENSTVTDKPGCQVSMTSDGVATTNKVYETDIL